jgi:hypothetical protein
MEMVKKVKVPKLADKPSAAIRQALEDLKAIEKLKKVYIVDMSTYHNHEFHSGDNDKRCFVCFAGAVIARAGNDTQQYIVPEDFPEKVANKLKGLDKFRNGLIVEGLNAFGVKKIPIVLDTNEYLDIADYRYHPGQFKKDMAELADNLEKLGL